MKIKGFNRIKFNLTNIAQNRLWTISSIFIMPFCVPFHQL